MKLDIELCRKILQKIQEDGGVNGLQNFPSIENENDDYVFYQIKKLNEAGYVKSKIFAKGLNSNYEYFKIDVTFQGHEFLRQMLDNTIWEKTKEMAKKSSMSLTFETIKAIIPLAIQSLINPNS
ncbi:DUF2513 domain-containing protein [Sphingobacterium spiritivorum]|uniref:DUF2513 domain-containing protein n=1 Tax=Sphingobacterium spiritivorum TaxID=258 RepID=UPI003DA4C82F